MEQEQPQTQQQIPELKIAEQKTSLLVLGMAGSGKTTFMQKLSQKIQSKYGDPGYIMNLDPAVKFVPYTPQIDIRNRIDIKKLMKEQGLGPNGAIVTAMNLYCTEIDQVVEKMNKNDYLSDFVLVDTPGQIEVFSWSASGKIISSALSTTMPTVLVYVIDIQRCMNPNSFMSNMIFSLSIFYKMKLPMILVFNKEDTGGKEKLESWMTDYETFLDALQDEKSYLSTLSKSMVLNLDEFYQNLNFCSVSSTLGTGFDDFFPLVEKAKKEYFDVTLPDLQASLKKRNKGEVEKQQQELKKFNEDKMQLEKEQSEKQQNNQQINQKDKNEVVIEQEVNEIDLNKK